MKMIDWHRGLCGAILRRIPGAWLSLIVAALPAAGSTASLEVGVAARDVTPELPIWLAGYAARKKPADQLDHPLLAQAIAFKDAGGQRFVLVSLDNCEVSRAFIAPVLQQVEQKFGLPPGAAMVVSSHSHSAPVLEQTLETMYQMSEAERDQVGRYSAQLRSKLVEAIGASLADLQPAQLECGIGKATFAMNRRVYKDDKIVFGENPDGPVDWEVPVLKVKGTNHTVKGILFGYACHGTSIHGDDFYIVSGDYMAYAREHLESVYPGAVAIYLTGMGADSNPSPRGRLLEAKRHGLELAGAVAGVLDRPMRPVRGPIQWKYAEVQLPLEDPPNREVLEQDANSQDPYIRARGRAALERLKNGESLPTSLSLPLAALRIGNDLTFIAMGGEVVVDYAIRFKRLFAADHPWLIGYAYHVPCYIPSVRILKEGGYEAQSSLIYYNIYGPFRPQIESILVSKMTELVQAVKQPLE